MLGTLNRLTFAQPSNGDIALATLDKLPETTPEVKVCCADLKVLGRKEFRLLLRWRLKAREIFGFRVKKDAAEQIAAEEVTEITPMDEELRIQEELKRMEDRESGRKKRERRRENERKQREITRMQLHMLPPTDIGLEQAGPNGEDAMFALAAVDRAGAIERVARGKMAVPAQPLEHSSQADSDNEEKSDPEEDQLDRELDSLYSQYHERKSMSDAKHRAKKARKEHQDGDWEGFSDPEQSDAEQFEEDLDSESDSMSADNIGDPASRLIMKSNTAPGLTSNGLTRKAAMFFDQDIFKDMGDLAEDEEDSAIYMESDDVKTDGVKEESLPVSQLCGNSSAAAPATTPQTDFNQPQTPFWPNTAPSTEIRSEDEAMASEATDNEDAGFEVVQAQHNDEWDRQDEPRKDGRLSKTTSMDEGSITDADQYLTPRYRHHHG